MQSIGLAADENFDNHIVRGLVLRRPNLDVVRVQDVGLAGAGDPAVLEWAAREGRILLTHDRALRQYADARIAAGQAMPGVCVVRKQAPPGLVIEDLLLLIEGTSAEEWAGQVRHVPL